MKINSVELTNFKFHHNLKFDIKNKNCLIYGENGTGKSSIYWALYSIFKSDFIEIEKYKSYEVSNPLDVKIKLDDNTQLKTDISSKVIENSNTNTIYFANQDLLELIISNKNFYEIIDNSLKKYFTKLNSYSKVFDDINNSIDNFNQEEMVKIRIDNIKNFELYLKNLESNSREIIDSFKEKFTISFEYNWGKSDIDMGNYKFSIPDIKIKIDGKENLKLNFNEAKLKLTSIAIFFALIKLEEDKTNSLKLLVLDDFLTSLDMANRHYIIEYILNEFEDYQKIIFTHNLQFYNLIINLLKSRDEIDKWDNKNIFLRNIADSKEAIIYNKNTNYLQLADDNLKNNRLDEAGIYLRKEFERLIEELRIINEVGAKEKLSNIISQLLELNNSNDINIKKMQKILKKAKFYQQTILHSTAHDNITNEKYIKELNGAITILKQLNRYLKTIKG